MLITNVSLCKLGTFQSLQNASPRSILFACHSILFLSECLYYLLFSIASYANISCTPSTPFTTITFLFNQFFLLFFSSPYWYTPEWLCIQWYHNCLYASIHESLLFSFLVFVPMANRTISHLPINPCTTTHHSCMVCKESATNLTRWAANWQGLYLFI